MKWLSLLKRFVLAETLAMAFFLALETIAFGAMRLVRTISPHAGDDFLVTIAYFWKLMAVSGIAVALIFGGPGYLICARWMSSRKGPLWVAGGLIAVGGPLVFAYVLGDILGGGCG